MAIRPEFNRRDIHSFVIRGGRITEAQQNALEQNWPQYGLSLSQGMIDREQAFGNTHPLVIEIGYGMGDSLLVMAEQERDKNFIGIDVHLPGVGRLVNEAHKRQLSNVKTYCADAVDVFNDCLAPDSVSRVQIYFPDPWHKKRHHKRRIIQPTFVDLVVSRLQAGGILHLATDWQPYAEAMLIVITECVTLKNLSLDGSYCLRPAYRPLTKFEQRGEKLGHAVFDLLFEKQA